MTYFDGLRAIYQLAIPDLVGNFVFCQLPKTILILVAPTGTTFRAGPSNNQKAEVELDMAHMTCDSVRAHFSPYSFAFQMSATQSSLLSPFHSKVGKCSLSYRDKKMHLKNNITERTICCFS